MASDPGTRHRNDMYGDLDRDPAQAPPPVPAATVVLLRESPEVEVLMLRKNSKIAFGGMWVFPGGRIDAEDRATDGDPEGTARNAAARETQEEAGIESAPEDFVWFAHWTPPPSTPKRFATWFFAARAGTHAVSIDDGEIKEHQWISPSVALERHAAVEIDLVPPTWVTLYHLSRYDTVDGLLERFRTTDATVYETHIGVCDDGTRVAMWRGDAGYETNHANAAGARHRLVMAKGGFDFQNTVMDY